MSKTSRTLLLEMNEHLIDFHTNVHGETQGDKSNRKIVALNKAHSVYLKLVELWALQNPHPMPATFIRKDGRLMARQYTKGTLSRYVLLENYKTFESVYEPLPDYDRVLMREQALGLGIIEWELDILEGYANGES